MSINKHDTRAGVAELMLGDVHVRADDYYFTLFILFCLLLFVFNASETYHLKKVFCFTLFLLFIT